MIKVRMRFPGRALGAMLIGLTLVVATGGISSADPTTQGGSKGSLTMGSKNLPGAQVLGQVYGQALQKDKYQMSYKENLGATEGGAEGEKGYCKGVTERRSANF